MKIILINPPMTAKKQAGSLEGVANMIMPLGIGHIAAVLEKEGLDVKIIDCIPTKTDINKLIQIIKKEKADVLAFTATILSINDAIKTVEILKKELPKTLFVIGGPHFTTLPKETMEKSKFDIGVKGEGEMTFLELMKELEKTKPNLKKIKGLIYKKGKKIIINPNRELIKNLDELPFPARHLYPPLELYTPMPGGYINLPFAHMLTSRGCPYQCIYCDRSVFGNKFRANSAERVIKEIEYLFKNYGIKEIKFYDDTFTMDRERVRKICNELIRKNIKISWSCSTRVDRVDEDLLKSMKKAGCWQIDYGIESGNQRMLDIMKKGIKLEQSINAIKWTKKAGIRVRAYIIIGMPGETKESIEDTINFVKKLKVDVVAFYAVMVYPGNELFQIINKETGLRHYDFDQFSSLIDVKSTRLHYIPKGLTEDYVKKSIARAYKEFYLRPSYIIRQIFSIRKFQDIQRYWTAFKTIIKI